MSYQYIIHGLRIASELKLPELAERPDQWPPDAWIRHGRLGQLTAMRPTSLPYLSLVADTDEAVITVEHVGRFLVKNGSDIVVDLVSGADEALARAYLFGRVMAMLCTQRGLLTLHASAVAFGDRVLAFAGRAGGGKSTLAASCVAAGGKLMSDDLLVVSVGEGGKAFAQPGAPSVKLWRDSLSFLGRDCSGLRTDWYRAEKFHLPLSTVEAPLPLARLYVIDPDGECGLDNFQRLAGAASLHALLMNNYRPDYVELLDRSEANFRLSAQVAQTIEVFALTPTRSFGALIPTVSRAIADLNAAL